MSMKFYKHPHDRSLKAFKEWFGWRFPPVLRARKTTLTKPWFTENEWIENWKVYWARVDGLSKGRSQGGGD